MLLNEIKMIINPKLSETQKRVMCIVKTAPTSIVGYEQTQTDENTVQAREMLVKIGMLRFDEEGGLVVTDDGETTMQRENLVDDMGELTDEGRALVNKDQPSPEI